MLGGIAIPRSAPGDLPLNNPIPEGRHHCTRSRKLLRGASVGDHSPWFGDQPLLQGVVHLRRLARGPAARLVKRAGPPRESNRA